MGERPGDPHPLIKVLNEGDSDVFYPETYSTEEPRILEDKYLKESFQGFCSWAKNNCCTLRRWLKLQRESWIRGVKRSSKRPYVFSLGNLQTDPSLPDLASKIKVREKAILLHI